MKLVREFKSVGSERNATPGVPEESKRAAVVAKAPEGNKATRSVGGRKPVTIEARIDVGFGNALYLRGEGQGLSWNRGVPLSCVDSSTWRWSAETGEQLKFKLLLNDSIWSQGEDLVARPGQSIQVSPQF